MSDERIREHVPLAPLTTLKLGGPARYIVDGATADDARAALDFARALALPLLVLGGGSNVVLPDAGFPGVVLHMTADDLAFASAGDAVEVTAGAGLSWDTLVADAVRRGLAGIECLSGIPGTVGGTPIQNVGAYGQEVAETLGRVTCLDRRTLDVVEFGTAECGFAYRWSRFKGADRDRYVVLGVQLRLRADRMPTLRYPELTAAVERVGGLAGLSPAAQVRRVRETVLTLRRSKAMVIDPTDPDTRSVGSFFLNPVLSPAAFADLEARWRAGGGDGAIPTFSVPDGVKVPAAWLVERAGFPKGTRRRGVGISSHHALALVNYDGTTADLLALADEIRAAVAARFGVELRPEPVIVTA
ncbi:MAG: UDP-N-acetylmuramate dehydrogenase [Gemmatimonadota bacterium]|nr:UDP-N-acetylmuramate dehydrogenase [Gemmatimonadota bacterium]